MPSIANDIEVSLRPAGPADAPFLLDLYESTRLEESAAWGMTQDEARDFARMQHAAQAAHYGRAFPVAEHRIVLRGDRAIGRVLVDRAGERDRLVDVSLLPEARGAGIGTALVSDLLRESGRAGRSVRLRVLDGSRAVRLYARLGFATVCVEGPYLEMQWTPRA